MGQLLGVAPAPMLSAAVWWEWMLTQRYLTGQMASELDLNGDQIAALWPLTVGPEGGPVEGRRRLVGAVRVRPPRRPEAARPDRVFYGWDPAPDDFRQPYSILQSAAIDVEVAVMVGRYNAAFLRNDARPAQVVVTEAFATQEDYDQFVAQFEAATWCRQRRACGVHRGGPGRALPSQAVTIQTLGLSQKDARILEQEQAALEHVAMALGVPWSRLSAADRTTPTPGRSRWTTGRAGEGRPEVRRRGERSWRTGRRRGRLVRPVGWDVEGAPAGDGAGGGDLVVLGGIAAPEEVRRSSVWPPSCRRALVPAGGRSERWPKPQQLGRLVVWLVSYRMAVRAHLRSSPRGR